VRLEVLLGDIRLGTDHGVGIHVVRRVLDQEEGVGVLVLLHVELLEWDGADPHLPIRGHEKGGRWRARFDPEGSSASGPIIHLQPVEGPHDVPALPVKRLFEPDFRDAPFDLDLSATKERLSIGTRRTDAQVPLHDLIVGDHVVGARGSRGTEQDHQHRQRHRPEHSPVSHGMSPPVSEPPRIERLPDAPIQPV
jgi:hypothetical protein